MKKILLLALGTMFLSCEASSSSTGDKAQQGIAVWAEEFAQSVLQAVSANEASFNRLLIKLKKEQYLREFNVDSISCESTQGNLGTFLDSICTGQTTTSQGKQLSVIQAKIIEALVYKKRTKKRGSPLTLFRELIRNALSSDNALEDLKRFHNAQLEGCTIHDSIDDDDDEQIYVYLQTMTRSKAPDSLRAKRICQILEIPEEGVGPIVTDQRSTATLEDHCSFLQCLTEALRNPSTRSDEYKRLKEFIHGKNLDIDSIEIYRGRMVGPLLDRMQGNGIDTLIELLKDSRSHRPLSLHDHLGMLIREAICAKSEDFDTHYKKLVDFYSAGAFNVDEIMFDVGFNEHNESLRQRSIGEYLDYYSGRGLVQAKIMATLVYKARRNKAFTTDPVNTVNKLIVEAVSKGKDEFVNFTRYYAKHPFDIDQIPSVYSKCTMGTRLIERIDELGKTAKKLGSQKFVINCFAVFEIVQKDRSEKEMVLEWLIKRLEVDNSVAPYLKKWARLCNISLETPIKNSNNQEITLNEHIMAFAPMHNNKVTPASPEQAARRNRSSNKGTKLSGLEAARKDSFSGYFTIRNFFIAGAFAIGAAYAYKRFVTKNRKDVSIDSSNSMPQISLMTKVA